MHDQVRMRVSHGRDDVKDESDPFHDREAVLVGERVDRQAVDVLENQIWLTTQAQAGIEEPADMWMRQTSEDRPLALKSFLSDAIEQREIQKLDSDLTLEASVAAPTAPHRAHAAHAEQVLQRIGADLLSRHRERPFDAVEVPFEKVTGGDPIVFSEEIFERGAEVW